ncbi:MAG: AI-2E family transporter [Candidatus Magasanikbacteria bacterium]
MDFSKMRHFIFFILLAIVTTAFFAIMKPFFYPIFWAAILAGIFYPLYKWLNGKIKVPNLSSTIILVLIFTIIVLPMIGLSTLVIKEALNLYSTASNKSGDINNSIQQTLQWVKQNPYTAQFNIDQSFLTQKVVELYQSITSFLLDSAKTITQNSVIFAVMFFIMLYALFFFIRDGEKFLKTIMHLMPLGDRYETILYKKFTSTVRATIKGSVIIGLVQGGLGWGMFALAGIQGALIWGLLMVLLATIPGIGCYFVWLPAAIIMLITGHITIGICMILFGTLVIGTIDNLIRPILVGKDSELHPLMVLFATLGGIAVFGISGFIIGPIIASLAIAFWEMYDEYYKKDLDNNNE